MNSKNTFKLLTYNVQVAIPTKGLPEYVLKSWRHIAPHSRHVETLDEIAKLIHPYDLVALQEIDSGSFRSQSINQIDYLAKSGGFEYNCQQTTRNLGKIAQHGKGILSRHELFDLQAHDLPSRIPGRGVLQVCLGEGEHKLYFLNVHLSLSAQAQKRQLQAIVDLIKNHQTMIIVGDFNMGPKKLEGSGFLKKTSLRIANPDCLTYPSWQPQKQLDYVLVIDDIEVQKFSVVESAGSDHLPVMVELRLPESIELLL